MSAVIETAAEIKVQSEECPDCLMGNLNWLLAQANHALASELAAAFAPLGITPRGHAVLGAAGSGAHTQKQLAELVGLDKTTMVATIDELEAAGFARRVPSLTDRRAHVIEVTPAGRKKFTAAMKTIQRVQDSVLASLGEEDGTALMECLGRLVKNRLAEPAACNGVRRREPRVSAL